MMWLKVYLQKFLGFFLGTRVFRKYREKKVVALAICTEFCILVNLTLSVC